MPGLYSAFMVFIIAMSMRIANAGKGGIFRVCSEALRVSFTKSRFRELLTCSGFTSGE